MSHLVGRCGGVEVYSDGMNKTEHRFTISTWVDSRSNRRDRTYIVTAATADEAIDEVSAQARRGVRQNVTVVVTITDVDGLGPPVDCPHAEQRRNSGFVRRPNGGLDCRARCARHDIHEHEVKR